jgi:kinesin family protein C2/C3
MKGKIRVYCRVRPLSNSELSRDESKVAAITIVDEFTLTINGKNGFKNYEFDSIFGPMSTQENVFDETKRLI